MSLIKPKKIEEFLIFYLKKTPMRCFDLVGKVQIDRPGTTKQAVYAALRLLRDEEQIIITKGVALLNIAWVNQMANFFNSTKYFYTKSFGQGSFLDLEDKERIKYYFNNANRTDIFWTHAYYLLLEQLGDSEPVFLYNPHEWFLLARNKNEMECMVSTVKKSHQFLMTSASRLPLDKFVSKYFDGTNSQYNMLSKPLFKENNYYVNIFGEFLIEVWLDKNVANQIEALYAKTTQWNEDVEKEIKRIIGLNGRMRMVISRNHAKAERIKKTLRKGFALKR